MCNRAPKPVLLRTVILQSFDTEEAAVAAAKAQLAQLEAAEKSGGPLLHRMRSELGTPIAVLVIDPNDDEYKVPSKPVSSEAN
jgi:hypothetical protein